MKKTLLALCLTTTFSSFAYADFITCSAEGNTFGVVRLRASADDAESVQDIFAQGTIKNQNGKTERLPIFTSTGSLVDGFQIAPAFYSGPQGIKKVFLSKKNGNFVLETKTFCNDYYQEENCQDGDLLDVSTDTAIHCSLDN